MGQGQAPDEGARIHENQLGFKTSAGEANDVKELATAQGAMTSGLPQSVNLPQPDPKARIA